MSGLVAVLLPQEESFDVVLRQIWDAGDAVLPVDDRLPPPARKAVLDDLRPTAVRDPAGSTTVLPDGLSVQSDDALVVATSGTTGDPKGVVLTHAAVQAAAAASHAHLDANPARDRWLACLPLAHVGGLSVVTRGVVTGTPVTVLAGFDATLVEQAAATHTLVSLVPTALGRIDASGYRAVLLGGSQPPDDLPPNVVTTYGMTETGGGVVYDGTPLEGVEIRVEDGSIHLRCPMLGRDYRDGTPLTDEHGWFATGDLGGWHDGRLIVHGRAGDLVVTGGENVWPHAVEEQLAPHPGVAEVAVAGRPDDEWGQRVVTWVVPSDVHAPVSLDELRAWGRDRLPAFALPRELRLVMSLPRTALGKIKRSALLDRA